MPKRFAKRRSSGGKRRVVRGRRRLTPSMFTTPSSKRAGMTSRPTRAPYGAPTKRPRSRMEAGGYYYNPPQKFRPSALAGPVGKGNVAAQVRGSKRAKGATKQGIKRKIMEALVYGANPIIKSDVKDIPSTQFDWSSGTQGHFTYVLANDPAAIEKKFLKIRDASYFNAAVAYPTASTDVNSQRMIVFPSKVIFNMKNTCTHTVYIEARVFKCKGYHGITSGQSWVEAMANDNLVQNHLAAPYPTEMTVNSLYNRPDMRSPYMNCRWTQMKS